MNLLKLALPFTLVCFALIACNQPTPKEDLKKNNGIFRVDAIDKLPENLTFFDTTYVPIYSDIYTQTTNIQINLTATLSLRNTSFKHSIYISEVDYYNSAGELDKNFTKQPIELKPMQSIEYVIEEDDISGGTGANFIIVWASKSEQVNPLFEAIMISTQNRQGISFTSRGVSISNRMVETKHSRIESERGKLEDLQN